MKNINIFCISTERWIYAALLLLLLFSLTFPMLRTGIWKGHDRSAHMLRYQSTVSALEAGQIPPIINSAHAESLGYSWNLFYPPLSAYLAYGVYKIFGKMEHINDIIILKLSWFAVIAMALCSMYVAARFFFSSRFAAFSAACFYVSAPYFLSVVYVRFAFGESLAFVFLPLLGLGLYSVLFKRGELNWLLTLGMTGILLSNIPSSIVVFFSLIALFFLFWRQFFSKRVFLQIILNMLFTMGLCVFFYVPLYEQWQTVAVHAFTDMAAPSLQRLQQNGLQVWQLLLPVKFARIVFYYGFPLLVAGGCLYYKLERTPFARKAAWACLLISIVTLKQFPWPILTPAFFDFIRLIQFPYRFLFLSIFLLSCLAAYNVNRVVPQAKQHKSSLLLLLACAACSFLIYPSGRITQLSPIESHAADYLPTKAWASYEYIKKRSAMPLILQGDGHITLVSKEPAAVSFAYSADVHDLIVELPFFAYLGYDALVRNQQTVARKLDLVESPQGLWTIRLPAGSSGTVEVLFSGTRLAQASFIISKWTFVLYLAYIFATFFITVSQKRRQSCSYFT